MHSKYNPEAEADRYIASLDIEAHTPYLILIEPGLGYMIPPLRKKAIHAKIIALHAAACPQSSPADAVWYPGMEKTLQNFLEDEIPQGEAKDIRMIEWRPALGLFERNYLYLIEETSTFIKRSDANARTIKSFGPRWFKNFFANLDIITLLVKPRLLDAPLIICGSGPSLEDAALRINKEHLDRGSFILAASSAVMALDYRNISPHMVISSDGGGWAKLHLYEYLRGNHPCPLAAAMTAQLPSQCSGVPILPLGDGSLWQTLILGSLGLPHMQLPQRGTVTATALDLAFALSNDSIYIAGMDLGSHDIKTHTRPYSFDRLLDETSNRFSPFYSQGFHRSTQLKEGGSYAIYASWFEKQLHSYPRPIYSLGRNNRVFEKTPRESSLGMKGRGEAAKDLSFDIIKQKEEKLSEKALAVLSSALSMPSHTEILRKELGELLFYGQSCPSADVLAQYCGDLIFSRRKAHG